MVRVAGVGDLAGILEVEQGSVGAPVWGEVRYREMLGDERRVVLVAIEGDEVAGYAVGSVVLDEAEIESVAVRVGDRRKGLGVKLCGEVMAWARGRGAGVVRLEVRAGNEAAREMYRRLGFEVEGMRRGYYKDPEEDAVTMVVRVGAL